MQKTSPPKSPPLQAKPAGPNEFDQREIASASWWSRPLALLILAILFLIGVAIRLIAAQEPLWLDELHTAWAVDSSFVDVIHRAEIGNQPPLYFQLNWLICQVFSLAPLSLRLISLISGGLILVGLSATTWKWTRSLFASIVVVGLAALDMQLLFYASEARPYAAVQLAGLFQLIAFIWFWQGEFFRCGQAWLRLTVLTFSSAVLIHLHYTASLLLVAEFIAVLVTTGFRFRCFDLANTFFRLFAGAFVGVVLISPIFANVLTVWGRKGNWQSVSSPEQLWNEMWTSLLVYVCFPILVLGITSFAARQSDDTTDPNSPKGEVQFPLALILAICGLGPFLIAMVLDLLGIVPLALARYIVVGTPAMLLFAGISIVAFKHPTFRLITGFSILAAAIYFNPWVTAFGTNGTPPSFRHENWRAPVSQINENEEFGSFPIFQLANVLEDVDAHDNLEEPFQDYLLFPVRGAYKLDETDREVFPLPTLAKQPFSETHIAAARKSGGVWILLRSTPDHADYVLSTFEKILQSRCNISEFTSPDSDVLLYLVQIPRDDH